MDHRRQIRPAIWFAATAAFAQDPSRTLEEARDKILQNAAQLPKLVCVETIDRSYFSRGDPPYPLPSCERIAIDRNKGRNKPKLDYTDRVRVAVTIAGQREIFSWTGTAPASYSIEDILNPGPIGTGAFAAHLLDIFSNPSVRFRLLQETAETLDYGFQVPVEASHYSIGAGGEWLATGYSGSFRILRESRNIGRFTVETNELPPETSACEMSSVLEFGDGTGWLSATKSTTHDVLRNASETDSVTTISDCRTPSATSPARFPGQGTPLEPGIVLTMLLDTPIDSDVAAAGDVISATITEAYFAGTKDVNLPRLKGAAVSGRIARVEHRMAHPGQPAFFAISVAFETLQVSGVTSPFYAKLLGRPPGTMTPVSEKSTHPPPSGHGQKDWSGTLMFASRNPRFVVETPFYTKWLTTERPTL